MLSTDLSGGQEIGPELLAALRRVRDEIGVEAVRAHAILHDDLGVYREVDGQPVHDFSRIDAVYDLLLSIGLRPCVEIGFMPRELASEPDKTVFAYRGIISPPKDWDRWFDLVRDLTAHLLERYGEPGVVVGLRGVERSQPRGVLEQHSRGVDAALRRHRQAVKDVDARIPVGGPSSAASGWVDDLLEHANRSGSPVDFVSTHTYGSPPLDLRPTLSRLGFPDARILWTEWGVTPTHFHPVNDGTSSATFLLSGMRSSAGRVDALSYWVASDHFEELGRPPQLLHGGFGLITVGGIAKPRYHALWLLAQLGDVELPVTASGDGADGLVQAWATRRGDGKVVVLVWCSTLDQTKRDGDPALARRVQLRLAGTSSKTQPSRVSTASTATLRLLPASWASMSGRRRPVGQAAHRRPASRLSRSTCTSDGDSSVIELVLPQPGAVLIEVG